MTDETEGTVLTAEDNRYNSRKFRLCAAVLLLTFIALCAGLVTGDIFARVVVTICGAYIIGNVTQHGIEAVAAAKGGAQ